MRYAGITGFKVASMKRRQAIHAGYFTVMKAWITVAVFIQACVVSGVTASEWRGEYPDREKRTMLILEQRGNLVDVYYRNTFSPAGAISTVTFEMKSAMDNLRSPVAFPLTMVARGDSPLKIATLTITDTTGRWNPNLYYNWSFGAPKSEHTGSVVYQLPYEREKKFRVCQGYNGPSTHRGEFAYSIDWMMPTGTPVCAAREGTVAAIEDRYGEGKFNRSFIPKTNYVFIQHVDGSVARYCHIVQGGAKVRPGQMVRAGDVIALSGNSGYSAGPHLHLDVCHPIDGNHRETVPVAFVTAFSKSETLLEGNVYYHDGGAMSSPRPVIDTDAIVLCRGIKNNEPAGAATSFRSGDDILLYIPIFTAGEYELKTVFRKELDQTDARSSSWRTHRSWWYSTSTLKTADMRDAAGQWKADVYVDGSMLRSLTFSVTR